MITFAAQKGGAGKSALTLHMGAELHARGRDVLLVDADPQATTATWHETGVRRGAAIPAVVAVGEGLRHAVAPLMPKHEYLLVDTEGRSTAKVGSALAITDVILLPTQPRPGDVWSLARTIRLVKETMRNERPDLKAAIVITCSRNTRIGRAALEALQASGLPVLRTQLRLSTDYDEALNAGEGIAQHKPASEFAAELRALVDEVEKTFPTPRRRRARRA